MNKTIAFYDHFVSGHHVEYFYHIAKTKIQLKTKNRFIFIVPKEFNKILNELIDTDTLEANNIYIFHLEHYLNLQKFDISPNVKSYIKIISVIKQIISAEKIDHCVFMHLNNYFQIALSSSEGRSIGCNISGIQFKPFGADGKGGGVGIKKHLLSIRKYIQIRILLLNPLVKNIYIIINKKTTNVLNKIHFTNKFKYVSDPILELKYLHPTIENDSSGNNDRKTFLLFGSLSKTKGVFVMLDAINSLNKEALKKIKVIFAGKLTEEIRDTFMKHFEDIRKKDPQCLVLIDKFIEFKDIPKLFLKSDCIVMPYESSQSSSGILGHAAYYEKPIIGPGEGIIKTHINTNKIGVAIDTINANKLSELLKEILNNKFDIPFNKELGQQYVNSRSSIFFGKTIIDSTY